MITNVYEHLLREKPDRFLLEANTPVKSIVRTSDSEYPLQLTTPRGQISAKHIVHCTEGHTAHLVPGLRGILVPRRGQMTVQSPGTSFPQASDRSWSFVIHDQLDYATQNPWSGEIVIGGGEVHGKQHLLGISSDAQEDVSALSHLSGVLSAVFGARNWGNEPCGKPRVKASWTGILCNSLDSVPLVGLLPESATGRHAGSETSREWISAGYGGYGMVNAFLCGKNLAKMIRGEEADTMFPPQYLLSNSRMEQLKSKLHRVVSSPQHHLRALL
jgi:glycine/D-amino acid oxidase-like deaminating enzyme